MMYSLGLLAMTLLSGTRAQQITDPACTGQAIQVEYEYCGTIGPNNDMSVYWTYREDLTPPQVNILFEATDDQMMAFGFSANVGRGPMDGANVVAGCQDFEGLAGAVLEVNLPAPGVTRNVTNVAAGATAAGMGRLNVMAAQEVRANGLCGVRFERLAILEDFVDADNITINVADGHDLVQGTPNFFVWARGNQAALNIHSSRGAGTQDFIGATQGAISAVNAVDNDGAASSISSLSAMIVGAISALAVALW